MTLDTMVPTDATTAFPTTAKEAQGMGASGTGSEFAQSAQIIIAGWYPDPADVDSLRWWDGTAWTEEVKARRPVTGPTPTVSAGSSTRAFPPVAIRTDAALPPIDPYKPKDKHVHDTYVPMASATTGLTLAPTHSYSTAVWWLASAPVWSSVVAVALIVALGDLYTGFLQLFSGLLLLVILIGLISSDRKNLLADNHPKPASGWWLLLTPLAYLIARGVRVHRATGRGWAPVVLYLLSSVVPIAAVLGVSYLLVLSFTL